MLQTLFALPLAQAFVKAPASAASGADWTPDTLLSVAFVTVVLLGVLVLLLRGRKTRPQARDGRTILIDGSNVIYWQDNTPRLEPLLQVVQELVRQGFRPGVVFDANVGYKLTGQFLGERELARLLSLPRDQILVVPKGTQADPYLLETAQDLKAQIVTNDRYRDWAESYPEVARSGTLIRGGMRNGRLWLAEGLERVRDMAS